MLRPTPRPVHTTMKNYFLPSGLLMAMIWIFILGAVSCKKHIPEFRLCTCDVEGEGGNKLDKGGKLSKELAICGVFDLPIDTPLSRAAAIEASLGFPLYGTYTYAELLSNPSQRFFSIPFLEAHTAGFKYFISASIKDLKGNPLVEIKDNKWFVNVENVGKYNYDATGFEVYDKAGHISLNFDFHSTAPVNLKVQGVIPTSASTLEYYATADPNFIDFQYGTPALNKAFQDIYNILPIRPIFRYEGSGWQHARLPL